MCACLCLSMHVRMAGVVMHACEQMSVWSVCVPVIVVRPPKCNHLSTEGCCLLGNSVVNFYYHVLN